MNSIFALHPIIDYAINSPFHEHIVIIPSAPQTPHRMSRDQRPSRTTNLLLPRPRYAIPFQSVPRSPVDYCQGIHIGLARIAGFGIPPQGILAYEYRHSITKDMAS